MGLSRFTDNTITDLNLLRRELALIRSRGFAVDAGEHEEGVRCLGAPIRNHEGQVLASVSVSGPAQRLRQERDAEFAQLLMDTTRSISEGLGYERRD